MDDGGDVPGVAPISDDGSVDSSLLSHASESEGDFWGNNNYDVTDLARRSCFRTKQRSISLANVRSVNQMM